jgi:GalNAc-alpha-(1->4)-GalNAc-alpha-(1->3)-diNAcBac-PP-undecaprenol alpha-1,4-N-acetyl-D-galactosaminyltransferase
MKHVMIVIGDMTFGGAERVTAYLANYFSDKGMKVTICSTKQGKVAYAFHQQIRHVTVSRHFNNRTAIGRLFHLSRVLRKQIRIEKPDVILAMMGYNGSATLLAAVGLGIPVFVSERIDPLSTTGRSSLEKRFMSFLFTHLSRGVIFQTEQARDYYPLKLRLKSAVIFNPLDVDALGDPIDVLTDVPLVVSVGRLAPQKNQGLLIRAFREVVNQIPQARLIIYGEGFSRGELQAEISQCGLSEHVTLPSNVSDIFDRLRVARLFVLSSDFEGMPNALIEAMALGLPVISSDFGGGGARALINHGVNGWLVKVNDQQALSEAMIRCLLDKELSVSMGKKAQAVRNTLDVHIICAQWLAFMEDRLK